MMDFDGRNRMMDFEETAERIIQLEGFALSLATIARYYGATATSAVGGPRPCLRKEVSG
jgi:hypothetical protein